MKKLSIKDGSVLLDDVELRQCTQIDLKNINPGSPMEVVLHVAVDEVDIRYSVTQTDSDTTRHFMKMRKDALSAVQSREKSPPCDL